MNKVKDKELERQEAIKTLLEFIKSGDRIYTSLNHVSSSGMSRRIRVLIPVHSEYEPNGMSIKDITWFVARAIGLRYNSDHSALVIGGVGSDMGYEVVYSLSSVLFRDNFTCIGEHCHSNDHTNDRDGSWSRENNKGRKHSDAGYSLSHSWI